MEDEQRVLDLLDMLRTSWLEIQPSDEVRAGAMRLLRIHGLKAADALQLAAARIWAGQMAGAELVTCNERLALFARLEGFRVLPRRATSPPPSYTSPGSRRTISGMPSKSPS